MEIKMKRLALNKILKLKNKTKMIIFFTQQIETIFLRQRNKS